MRRPGHTYRIHDFKVRGRNLAIAFDHHGRAGCYYPVITVHYGGRRLRVPVPHVSWARGWKLRHLGGLRLYAINYRIIHALFR